MENPRYMQPASRFIEDVNTPAGMDLLVSQLKTKQTGAEASLAGEEGSWRNSLPHMARVLETANRPELWVMLEYRPFQAGNQRADVILLGRKNGKRAVLVVELKQWSKASWDPESHKAYDFGAKYKESRHPYDQSDDYARFITNYTAGFHPSGATVESAAFLHNASSERIQQLWTAGAMHQERTFAGDAAGIEAFAELIRDYFDEDESGQETALALRDAKPEQGPEILEAASRFFQDPDAFPLTDEQHEVVSTVQGILRETEKDMDNLSKKAIVVIQGAAGSGKTWICVHLLAAEAKGQHQVAFATNSSQLRASLQKAAKATPETKSLQGMITSARSYWDLESHAGTKDLLIVDEAQRISEWTIRTGFGNAKHVQAELEEKNITQLRELVQTAKVVVLMMGTHQQANPADYLTVEKAEELADRLHIPFHYMELTEQHRSRGSKAYEEWVQSLVNGDPEVWHDQDGFTVKVTDSPAELEALTMSSDGDNRLLAGFAWEWKKWPKPAPNSIDEVPFDIVEGEWKKRWNLRNKIDGYPSDVNWPLDPKGAEQVGSIFTSQGFEFDNVGVLLGRDFVYSPSEARMIVDIEESKYGKLAQKARKDESFGERIRDQYNVLLTRGMSSIALHSVDPETNAFLKSIVNP